MQTTQISRALHVSITVPELVSMVSAQLVGMFPDLRISGIDLHRYVDIALQRLEYCFARVRLKYFADEKGPRFDHRNTDHYAMFCYFLSNTVFRANGDPHLAARVYAMNKALHAIDAYYEVELPSVFAFQHPVGTVLGRATYSDYFLVYQRCSVGSSIDHDYPVIGPGVVMFGGSAIIGNSNVAGNCLFAVNAVAMDSEVPESSIVFGQSPSLTIKPSRRNVIRDVFGQRNV